MEVKEKVAITAIGSSDCESWFAAALQRLGWEIIFRALSFKELKEFIGTRDEDVLTLISPDLRGYEKNFNDDRVIHLTGDLISDFALEQLIQGASKREISPIADLPKGIKVIALASLQPGVGVSTLALNIAQEAAIDGKKTLFIDGNQRNPFASHHFSLYGAHREIREISPLLSIVEAPNREHLPHLDLSLTEVNLLVLDCGEIARPQERCEGGRLEDLSLKWAAHNADEMLIIINEESAEKDLYQERYRQWLSIPKKPLTHLIFNRCTPIKRSELERVKSQIASRLSGEFSTLPSDASALNEATRNRSTLAISSPKSRLRREIRAISQSRGWWLT